MRMGWCVPHPPPWRFWHLPNSCLTGGYFVVCFHNVTRFALIAPHVHCSGVVYVTHFKVSRKSVTGFWKKSLPKGL